MIIIVCVDKQDGMTFNNRRQSRDKKLIEHILNKIQNRRLWINDFSQDIFDISNESNIIIDNHFIDKIGEEEYCFIENINVSSLVHKADKIIVYNWNRHYPADKYLDVSLEDWKLDSEYEFTGSSHDKITERIYLRGER